MKNKFILLSLSLISVTPILTQAGEWTGEGDVGYNSVSGNTDSQSLAIGVNGTYTEGNWAHSGKLDVYRAEQENVDNAKSFSIALQTDYTFSGTAFAYIAARYLDDDFSGYATQTALTAGVGKTFLEDGNNLFKAQLGAGYRESEPNQPIGGPELEDENEAIINGVIDYNRQLTDNTIFSSNWQVEAGEENTYIEAGVALTVSMSDALGLKLAFTAKHNTDVPVGTEKTDKYTTVSLNYKFL